MTAIVFVHGLLDRSSDYSLLNEALAQFGTVVAEDAPGHVTPLGHPFRMVEWLEAVESQLSQHERPILVGHSAGGHVAMLAAGRNPDAVVGVVALETPMRVLRELMLSAPAQAQLATLATDPVLADVVHFLALGDLDSFFEGFDEDAVDPGITCPVLLVAADPRHGALLTNGEMKRATDTLTDIRAVSMSGLGHMLGIDTDPTRLVRILETYLKEITSR